MKDRPLPPKPFRTDGCSGLLMRAVHLYWRLTGQQELSHRVTLLCRGHDTEYWRGGSAVDRVKADGNLAIEIAKLGLPFLARLMFVGVSIGGHPLVPRHWRWGYGWPYPYQYQKEQ